MYDFKEQKEIELFEKTERYNYFYIYGAGIVAKRFYEVLKKRNLHRGLIGFLVSELNNREVNGVKVFSIDEIKHKQVNIFIAVGDAYINEIINNLEVMGFENFTNAYIYSFLDSEYVSEELEMPVPKEATVMVNELMSMQYINNKFIRYNLLCKLRNSEEMRRNIGKINESVVVNSRLVVVDNEDSLIYAIKNNQESIHICVDYSAQVKECGLEWLHNQAEYAVDKIDHDLHCYEKKWREPFVALIWPPALSISDEIVCEISRKFDIKKKYEIEFANKRELERFIRLVYDSDDVISSYIDDKIVRILQEKKYIVNVVEFFVSEPEFHIKKYGHLISKTGIDFKNAIREKHQSRIANYIFDVVIHTTDNYVQSRRVRNILEDYSC